MMKFNSQIKHSPIFRATLCMLFFMLYVLGSAKLHGFHDFFHDHKSVGHDENIEADACHRTIYHNDFQTGCEHTAHFTESIDCDWKDELATTYDYPDSILEIVRANSVMSHVTSHDKNFSSGLYLLLPARGPPSES